jgi:prolyl oligopeptidase
VKHSPDRRRLLAQCSAAWTLSTLPPRLLAAVPRAPARSPVARVEPVVEEVFGTRVVDDYRWMENPRDPDWLPFLQGQNKHARAVLDARPGHAALAWRIAALSGDTTATREVRGAGERLFYEQRPAGANHYMLFVREAGRPERVLIDPATLKSGNVHTSLDWWAPSFDGRHVVYGLSLAGSEASVLHVMAVDSGAILPERIEMTDDASPAWLPDGSGFFYIQLTGQRGTPTLYQHSVVKLHRLSTDPGSDAIVMGSGRDPAVPIEPLQFTRIVTAPEAAQALAIVFDIRTEFALYVTPLDMLAAGRPQWRRVADFDALITAAALVGDALYLLSNRGAVRGRVLRVPLAAPDLERATVVMPQGATVIDELVGARDGVYVRLMDGGVHRLARIGRDDKVAELALPFEGAVSRLFTAPDQDGTYLALEGWLRPGGIWRVDADGRIADTGLTPRPPIDLKPYEARRFFAVARDGVRVPYTVIRRKGTRGRPHSTLVSAYGAYQYSTTPRFAPTLLPFLDAGGVYVNANVRGGGEYGREWHQAGKKASKPNTWRDLIDICDKLVRERLTTPRQLAITGTSAGGIAVGRAMTERPDLFAAVISNVGWSNPIRYMAEQNIADIREWGPAEDAASFRIMLAMDSVQAVRNGVRYPALLCVTGATDPRVAPWHVAKLAARVQVASTSGKPVLLRVDFDAGHGIGSTRSQRDALAADIYAFVLWQTGAKLRSQ